MQTLTRHETPVELSEIMLNAWGFFRKGNEGNFSEALKRAWAIAKAVAGDCIPSRPRTITSHVIKIGGIKPGPLTNGLPLCVMNRRGLPIDLASESAEQVGFQTEGDGDALREMILDETHGAYHFSLNDLEILVKIEEFNALFEMRAESEALKKELEEIPF